MPVLSTFFLFSGSSHASNDCAKHTATMVSIWAFCSCPCIFIIEVLTFTLCIILHFCITWRHCISYPCPNGATCTGPDGIITADGGYYLYVHASGEIDAIQCNGDSCGSATDLSFANLEPSATVLSFNISNGNSSSSSNSFNVSSESGSLSTLSALSGCFDSSPNPNVIHVFTCCGTNRKQDKDNYICGTCAEGFNEVNGVCKPCNGVNYSVLFALIVAQFAMVMFCIASFQRSFVVSPFKALCPLRMVCMGVGTVY